MPHHTTDPLPLTEQVASLLGAAQVYTGDPSRAESLVLEVLRTAGREAALVERHRLLWRGWQAHLAHTATSTSAPSGSPPLHDALAALPPAARAAVHLVDVEGLSYAELATVLGTDREQAAALLHDARRRLVPAVTAAPSATPSRRR